MGLVGQRVGEQDHVGVAVDDADGLDLALVLVDELLAHEALDEVVVGRPDEGLGALRDLDEVVAAVAVHQVVALGLVGRGDDVVLGELDRGQGVEAHPADLLGVVELGQAGVLDELQCVRGVADVGGAGLDLRGDLVGVGGVLAAGDDGGLVGAAGQLEAHLLRHGEEVPVALGVVTVVVVLQAELVAVSVLLELAVGLGDVDLEVVLDVARLGGLVALGGGQDVLVGDQAEVGGGDDVVALVLALGDKADLGALLEQVVDGADGLQAVVADDRDDALALDAGLELRGLADLLQALLREGADGADGVHVVAAEGGEVGDGLAVERSGGPVVDDQVRVQGAVGHVPLGLVHVDHDGAGLVGLVADLGVLGQAGDLDVVVDQELDRLGGGGAVLLALGAGRDDVVLGEEVVVLVVVRAERVGLGAGLVVLADVVLADLGGVDVLDAAAPALELVPVQLVLVLDDELGVADEAVLEGVDAVAGGDGNLNRERVGAVHHRVLRGVAGGHVVERVVPRDRAVVLALEVVAHRDLGRVQGLVVGDGDAGEVLALLHGLVDEQVVLVVRVVRRRAGLDLVLLVVAVDLVQRDGAPLGDELGHRLGLGLGLVGVVAVQVEAVAVGAADGRTGIDVLGRDEDEEDVLEDLLRVEPLGATVVVKVELLLGQVGRGVVQAAHAPGLAIVDTVGVAAVAADVADAGDLVLDEVGPDGAVGVHLGLELAPALVGEAGQAGVVDGLAVDEVVGELHDAVDGDNLVGVDVAVEDGDLVVELAGLKLLLDGRRVLLGHLHEGLVVLEVLLVGSDEEGLHLAALGGGAEGLDLGVQAVGGSLLRELRQLLVDLHLGAVLVIDPEVDVGRGDLTVVEGAGELVGARVVIHAGKDDGAGGVIDAKENLVAKAQDEARLSVLLHGLHVNVVEQLRGRSALRGDGLPVLERTTQGLVGIVGEVMGTLLTREGELDLAIVNHLLQGGGIDAVDVDGDLELTLLDHRDHGLGALSEIVIDTRERDVTKLGVGRVGDGGVDPDDRRLVDGNRSGLLGMRDSGGGDTCGDGGGGDGHQDATLRPGPVGGLGVQDSEGPPLLCHVTLRSLTTKRLPTRTETNL